MIKDINQLDNLGELQCDICIVGAGAAGITLAMEFEDSDKSVILLEAGGFDFPKPEELELYSGELSGREYQIQSSRLRYFGGSTNHWGGWCRPLDSIDFKTKRYIDYSGWPITVQDLEQYYKKAADICEIKNYGDYYLFNETEISNLIDLKHSSIFTNKFFMFSPPTRFGETYRKNIQQSNSIQCYLNANATDLIFDNNKVIGLTVKTLDGKRFTVKTKMVILAMGGLENTRFLLLNTNNYKPGGIPNHNGMIGKFFMDHPGFSPGHALLHNGLKYYRHQGSSSALMPVMSLSDKTMIENELNNVAFILKPKKPDNIITNEYFENSFLEFQDAGGFYRIQGIFEPTPYIKSTVSIADSVDALGLKKLNLNWEIAPNDYLNMEKIIQLVYKELAYLGHGRIKLNENFIERARNRMGYGMHHMGTTRMGNDSKTSVVSSFGQMHEVPNLYIAGSSVFPSVGFSNPTLTIVALALRQADYLKQS